MKLELIDQTGKKRTVFTNLTLTEKALWRVNDCYKAFAGNELPALDMDEPEFCDWLRDELMGATGNINVTHEIVPAGKHAGKTREVVNF
jgi:hypothetical protein